MTTKNKKIILGTSIGVIVAGTIYLLYKRSVNKKNSQLMLEYISEIPKTNTTGALQELGNKITYSVLSQIDTTDMTKIPTKEFIVDKNTYKSIKDLNKTNKMTEIVKDINKAVSSIKGTDTDLFYKTIARLGNRSALIYANALYKGLYKETMWDAIRGETLLYTKSMKFADPFNLAGLTDYSPTIVSYLNYIKDK